jgi:hypothetical protein
MIRHVGLRKAHAAAVILPMTFRLMCRFISALRCEKRRRIDGAMEPPAAPMNELRNACLKTVRNPNPLCAENR